MRGWGERERVEKVEEVKNMKTKRKERKSNWAREVSKSSCTCVYHFFISYS
jgi:hypothetical protein